MDDREYLPLSWLSQANYCLRRAALLLNERVWEENAETAKGRAEHRNVHAQRVERRGDHLKLYEYTVFSDTLGLVGKCDCIEAVRSENGCVIPAAKFPVQLYPIEYKHGSVREELSYQIQLCAQAMCLEEMFHTEISCVPFTDELRKTVERTAENLRSIRDSLRVPAAEYSARCKRCSLKEYCMPKVKTSARTYCELLSSEAKEVEPL